MPQSLYSTIGFRNILRPINQSLKSEGLSLTLRNIIKKCSRGFDVDLPKTTKKVLKNNRVLLICNHPVQADVLILLAAIPPRKKTFLVVMHGLLSILPAINKHLIPVYISHRIDSESQHDWKMSLLKKIHYVPEYSPEVSHQKNLKSISLASRKIDENSLVGIFPAGGSKNGRDFLPGVGYIIKNLKYPQKTNIVMAHVEGTSTWDFLRIIPFLNKIFPKFKINFSEPLPASDFAGENGRLISEHLQNVYDRWSLPFEPLPKFQVAALYLRSLFFFFLFKG